MVPPHTAGPEAADEEMVMANGTKRHPDVERNSIASAEYEAAMNFDYYTIGAGRLTPPRSEHQPTQHQEPPQEGKV